MILKEIQKIFHKELDAIYGKEEVDSFFYMLMDEYLGMQRLSLSLQPQFAITKEEEQPLFEALSKLKLDVPIQHILGKTEFMDLEFKVTKDTLIPRPETEELVRKILEDVASQSGDINIIDIGTGSGCIAISLAKYLPDATLFALDISEAALSVAKENALLNKVNVTFLQKDILNRQQLIADIEDLKFDIIVSNPPYVRHLEKQEMKNNVLNHDPELALYVEDDKPLVFYQAIAEFASFNLKNKGCLYFEINQYLGKEMIDLMKDYGFKNVELIKDFYGNDRIIKALWKPE